MTDIVMLPRFSPVGYRWFCKVVAATLPKREHLPSYETYAADIDRETRRLVERDIIVQPLLIDIPRMLEWIDEQGLKPDAASRKAYIRAKYGPDPMRRIRQHRKRCERDGVDPRELRQAGTLVCWQSGVDSRWPGGTPPRPSGGLTTALEKVRRAEIVRQPGEVE